MDQPKENDSITSEEIENDQGKINFSDLWNGKPDSPMKPKGKYVCNKCIITILDFSSEICSCSLVRMRIKLRLEIFLRTYCKQGFRF